MICVQDLKGIGVQPEHLNASTSLRFFCDDTDPVHSLFKGQRAALLLETIRVQSPIHKIADFKLYFFQYLPAVNKLWQLPQYRLLRTT